MSGLGSLGHRLYSGEVSYDFVGRKKTWYVVSAVIILVAVGAILLRGLNLGIEFRGGADFSLPNATCSVEQARVTAETATGAQAIVTETASGTVRVQTESLTPAESSVLAGELADTCGIPKSEVKVQVVGPTWGEEVSQQGAHRACSSSSSWSSAYLTIRFEWRMAAWRRCVAARARPPHHGRRLRGPAGLEVTPGDRHRLPHHPRLFALRHHRGVRQGARAHGAAVDQPVATPTPRHHEQRP